MRPPLARFYEFLDRPLTTWTRWSLPLLCVPIVLAFWQPLWRISMEAPQYPNGLWMEVYVHELRAGHDGHDIAEINTLNHYIGMHQIVPADFAELGYMPFVLGALIVLSLRVAAIGNVRMLIDLAVGSGYALGFLFARFVYRLYVFGHELDPKAPFDVEPFTPVIVGTKQIANFTTHSFPQAGTYLVGVFAVGVMLVMATELWMGRRRALRAELSAPTDPSHLPRLQRTIGP
jgi:copper chaperone NosL